MNIHEQNFLNLISAALWNKDVKLNNPVDYEAILSIAQEQQLFAMAFEKLCQLDEFVSSSVYKQKSVKQRLIVFAQMQRTDAFLKLYRKFQIENINPLVLKGLVCRQNYGIYSDHRPSSDEDILIKKEEYVKVCDVLNNNDYFCKNSDDTNADLDHVQAVSFWGKENGVHIEVHINPMGHETELQKKMDSYFHDVFENTRRINVNGVEISTLNHTKHFLFLIFHAFRHFTSYGLGIRQLIDIGMYEDKFYDEIDWNYINDALYKVKANKFFTDVVVILNNYLEFKLPVKSCSYCPNELLEDLFSSGIFGNDTEAKVMAGTMTFMAIENQHSKGIGDKIKSFIKTVFPDKEYMLRRNPEIKEKPWLMPFKMISRWGKFIKLNNTSSGSLASESMRRGNRRIDLFKKYNIIK